MKKNHYLWHLENQNLSSTKPPCTLLQWGAASSFDHPLPRASSRQWPEWHSNVQADLLIVIFSFKTPVQLNASKYLSKASGLLQRAGLCSPLRPNSLHAPVVHWDLAAPAFQTVLRHRPLLLISWAWYFFCCLKNFPPGFQMFLLTRAVNPLYSPPTLFCWYSS